MRITKGGRTRRAGHERAYTPTPVAGGFQLTTGVGRFAAAKFLGAFLALWMTVSSVFVVIGIAGGETAMAAFGGLFVIIGLVVGGGLVHAIRVGRAWGDAVAIIDRWPLRLGESASGWFHQKAMGDGSPPDLVTASLILRESATYRVGTDSRTATEDVLVRPLELAAEVRNGRPGFGFSFAIPHDGPPTIELPHNLVEWLVLFELSERDAPGTTSLFAIRVVPETAA